MQVGDGVIAKFDCRVYHGIYNHTWHELPLIVASTIEMFEVFADHMWTVHLDQQFTGIDCVLHYVGYECALRHGLAAYVIGAPRENIVDMNREGLVGVVGTCSRLCKKMCRHVHLSSWS